MPIKQFLIFTFLTVFSELLPALHFFFLLPAFTLWLQQLHILFVIRPLFIIFPIFTELNVSPPQSAFTPLLQRLHILFILRPPYIIFPIFTELNVSPLQSVVESKLFNKSILVMPFLFGQDVNLLVKYCSNKFPL